MSTVQPFVAQNEEGIEEIRVSTVDDIESPSYLPEIKGPEDLHVLLRNLQVLEDNNPILVPGHRWENIWAKGEFARYDQRMRNLHSHPLIYYEPPELFRYTMPEVLKTYALRGSLSKAKKFKKLAKDGDIDGAIDQLPLFFQPFMEFQRESLLKKYDVPVPSSIEDTDKKITDGWRDSRANRGYDGYFRTIVEDARDAQNAHVVPPVPAVLSSSDRNVIRRMRGSNRAMAEICETANLGFGNPIHSYYHCYIDYRVFKSDDNLSGAIIDALQTDLSTQSYAGVVITVTGYENAWMNKLGIRLEDFINSVSNISQRHETPLLLPRSGWYGEHLTDHGAHAFGSLLNGNERYKPRGGGMPKNKPYLKYGKTALYGDAVELDLQDLETYLQNSGGQMTQITGLPDQPPTYNPQKNSYKDRFGTANEFRVEFSKPRRLIHIEEARELRGDLRSGVANPARRYLERSNHDLLS